MSFRARPVSFRVYLIPKHLSTLNERRGKKLARWKTTWPFEDACCWVGCASDHTHDIAEDFPDCWTEQSQNDNHDNRNENKNQSIFDQTLSSLCRKEEHCSHPLSVMDV